MRVRVFIVSALTVLLICTSVLAEPCLFMCGSPREHLGDAFRAQRDNQILNPDAQWNMEPVEGLDGNAAEHVYNRYVDSFKKSGSKQTSGVSTVGFLPVMTGSSTSSGGGY